MVIAALDGYIAITEWSLFAPGTLLSNARR
jgi:hypothetical protein